MPSPQSVYLKRPISSLRLVPRSLYVTPDTLSRWTQRGLGSEGAQPQVEGALEARVDEPGQRDILRPRAQAAQKGTGPEQTVVAEAERREKGRQPRARRPRSPGSAGWRRHRGRVSCF